MNALGMAKLFGVSGGNERERSLQLLDPSAVLLVKQTTIVVLQKSFHSSNGMLAPYAESGRCEPGSG